jgi:hypothetical protein
MWYRRIAAVRQSAWCVLIDPGQPEVLGEFLGVSRAGERPGSIPDGTWPRHQ